MKFAALFRGSKGIAARRDLECLLARLTASLGLVFFSVVLSFGADTDEFVAVQNVPERWQRRYQQRHYRLVDPVLLQARRSTEPFIWSELTPADTRAREFWEDCARHGLADGLTATIRPAASTGGALSLISRHPLALEEPARTQWLALTALAASTLGAAAGRALAAEVPVGVGRSRLTPRELACLRRAAAGLTNRQIASALSITPRTVAFHFDQAMQKLGLHSRRALIAEAIRRGFI